MRLDYYSQRSDRLAVTQLTVRSPAHPLVAQPTARQPKCAVTVLTSAPSTGVAHTRYTSVRPTAGNVDRNLHRSTVACVATLAGTSIQTTDTSVHDQSCRRQMRASRGTGWSDGRATVLSEHPIAQRGGAK